MKSKNVNKYQIIRYFLTNQIISSDKIAEVFSISLKSIRNLIDEINSDLKNNGAQIVSKHGSGYYIQIDDTDLFNIYMHNVANNDDDISIKTLSHLIFDDSYVKLDDLCEELFISRSSMRNIMTNVRKILDSYGLELISKKNTGLQIIGLESDIRKCAIEKLNNYCFKGKEDYDQKIPYINKVLIDTFENYQLPIMILTHEQLVDHLVVFINRWSIGKFITLNDDYENILDKKGIEYLVAKEITKKLCKHFKCKYSENEVIFLALYLIGNKVNNRKENKNSIIDLNGLINEIMIKIDNSFKTSFHTNNDLKFAIMLHISPLLSRVKYNITRSNPLTAHIKLHFPLSYEMAVMFTLELQKELNITLNEGEIGYIALHFGVALQLENKIKGKYKILVVCPFGHTMASLTAIRLNKIFTDYISCIDKNSLVKSDNSIYKNYDLVISLGNISDKRNIKEYVEITPSLDDKDIQKIENAFIRLQNKKRLVDFMSKDLFFVDVQGKTNEEVLANIIKMMPKKYKQPEWLLDSLLERERLAPTDVGNLVAIPHTVRNDFDSTTITVAILENPIMWNHEYVKLILLFCLNPKTSGDLTLLYDDLVKLVVNENLVLKILLEKSFDYLYKALKEIE